MRYSFRGGGLPKFQRPIGYVEIRLLEKHPELGLTENDLRKWRSPKYNPYGGLTDFFEEEHKDALIFLMKEGKLTKENAINEINELTDLQATALESCYEEGLRGDHLRAWAALEFPHSLFCGEHLTALLFLIKEKMVQPDQAVDELKGLNLKEASILENFYDHGLRGKDLKENKPYFSYTEEYQSILKFLVMEDKLTPRDAIVKLNTLSSQEVYDSIMIRMPKKLETEEETIQRRVAEILREKEITAGKVKPDSSSQSSAQDKTSGFPNKRG